MSDLQAVRPNRKARLAQKALAGRPVPNMQPRQRGIPPVIGAAVAPGPIGPAIVVTLDGGIQIPVFLTPDQARQYAIALISLAANMEMAKKMADDQAADGQPVPTSPEAEALLAEAIAEAGGPVALKGDEEGEVDDDPDLRINGFPVRFIDGPPPLQGAEHPVEFAPNSFDINGQPCYEPPADSTDQTEAVLIGH